MPMNAIIAQIDEQVATYAPAVRVAVQQVEVSDPNASGESKFEAVMSGILALSAALEGSPNQNVAGIAGLVNLTVHVFNALGKFKHKAAVTTPPAGPAVAVAVAHV